VGKKFIVFDLDGTISDPKDGIVRSINFALNTLGYEPRSEDKLTKYIGPPLDKTFEELVASTDQELIRSLVTRYRERYAQVGFSENTLYPGIRESLETIANRYPLAICTSKRVDFAEKILALFDLSHLFQVVNGADIGISKSQQLERLLAEGTIGADSIMVGDRNVDMIGARDNRLLSVGVLWGYGDRDELSHESPNIILQHPDQLPEAIT
tara:strand:- start:308 stop:940 length:633 start_codon:yes stop_codon:yes gene_type:complete